MRQWHISCKVFLFRFLQGQCTAFPLSIYPKQSAKFQQFPLWLQTRLAALQGSEVPAPPLATECFWETLFLFGCAYPCVSSTRSDLAASIARQCGKVPIFVLRLNTANFFSIATISSALQFFSFVEILPAHRVPRRLFTQNNFQAFHFFRKFKVYHL